MANLEKRARMPKPKIIVFSGPPCSGKTELAHLLSERHPDFRYFQMDTIRVRLFPQSEHGGEHRHISYQVMHLMADEFLQSGHTVILDATYGPQHHRQALAEISYARNVPIYLIECQVSPADAVSRFMRRPPGHPAADLTAEKVEGHARTFEYSGLGLILETARDKIACLRDIEHFLSSGEPIPAASWAKLPSQTAAAGGSGGRGKEDLYVTKYSRRLASRQKAKVTFAVLLAIVCFSLGLIPALAKFVLVHFFPLWQPVRFHWLWELVYHMDAPAWGTFWIALGSIIGVFHPFKEYFHPILERAKVKSSVGEVPRYAPCWNERPSDQRLYEEYLERSENRSGFKIPGVPIYFVLEPRQPFDVLVSQGNEEFSDDELIRRAAELGLDWRGFRAWRVAERRKDYYGYSDSPSLRCTQIAWHNGIVGLTAARCLWTDYLCTELSVNLHGSTLVPEMRELFEGDAWGGKSIDLSDLAGASRRYSLLVSTCTLVTTRDGYLVLQRRSSHVSEGTGVLSATASGSSEWADLFGPTRLYRSSRILAQTKRKIRLSSLCWAALRELREETAIDSRLDDLNAPFLGAAFNLLHGRDLNFYAHFSSKLTVEDVSRLRNKAEDSWEVANLLFVHVRNLDDEGRFLPPFSRLMPECNRHLRAALFAFCRSGKLQIVRDRIEKRGELGALQDPSFE